MTEWIPQWGEAVYVRDRDTDEWEEGVFYAEEGGAFPYSVLTKAGISTWFRIKPRPQALYMRDVGAKSEGVKIKIIRLEDGSLEAQWLGATCKIEVSIVD